MHSTVRGFILASVLCALASWVGQASAQVNTERLRSSKAEPGFSGGIGTAATFKSGNVDFLKLSGTAFGRYLIDIQSFILHSRGAVAEESDQLFERSAFVHGRWTAMWHDVVGSEVFAQAEYDEFIGMQLRLLAGLGPRFVVVDEEVVQLYIGTGYMLESEQLSFEPDDGHPRYVLANRSTSYVAVKVNPSEQLTLMHTLYVQPRFDIPKDVRILDELEFQFALMESLKVTISGRLRYDSIPPAPVEKLDIGIENGIEVNF